eukprot:scaffold118680_cov53-Prasinocladus_malaysianus.AAC.1
MRLVGCEAWVVRRIQRLMYVRVGVPGVQGGESLSGRVLSSIHVFAVGQICRYACRMTVIAIQHCSPCCMRCPPPKQRQQHCSKSRDGVTK